MYTPEPFRVADRAALHRFLSEHSFGMLITAGAAGLQASPLPFLLDPAGGRNGVLRAHMARANPHLGALRAGAECLVLFQGPQGYVSPSWYPSKQAEHKAVPTWNYAMVEVRGTVTVVEDAGWLREHVGALSATHEQDRRPPWSVDEAPAAFISQLLGAIAGLEIVIDAIEGKFKLSQNRAGADQHGVLEALASDHDPHRNHDLAALMRAAGCLKR